MKTNRLLSISSALVIAFSALSMNNAVFAETYKCSYTSEQIAASEIKPFLTVSSISVTQEEAEKSPVQTLSLSISGADGKYCSSGFHIYFDQRLELVPNSKGKAASAEKTVSDLNSSSIAKDKCIFLATSGLKDYGTDGVMWTFSFRLPSDAKSGDFFPVDVVYESKKLTEDVFNNADDNECGRLIQAWLFTNGIKNGGITVSGDEATSAIAGDANCDGTVNMGDCVLIMQSLVNPDKYGSEGSDTTHITAQGMTNADVYGNDGVTNLDSLTICKYLLELIDTLPVR